MGCKTACVAVCVANLHLSLESQDAVRLDKRQQELDQLQTEERDVIIGAGVLPRQHLCMLGAISCDPITSGDIHSKKTL